MRFATTLAAVGFAAAALAANAVPGGGPGYGPGCAAGNPQACGAGGPGGWGGRGGGVNFLERLKAADTNADGLISRAEAAALPGIAANFDAIDANKDGQVSFEELQAHRSQRHAQFEARRADHFRQLDTNGDGLLSRAEAEAGAPGLAARFDTIDANKDGQLSQEELTSARGRGRPGRL